MVWVSARTPESITTSKQVLKAHHDEVQAARQGGAARAVADRPTDDDDVDI
jgi:hypothetical protein